jgi:hypothetical protein
MSPTRSIRVLVFLYSKGSIKIEIRAKSNRLFFYITLAFKIGKKYTALYFNRKYRLREKMLCIRESDLQRH